MTDDPFADVVAASGGVLDVAASPFATAPGQAPPLLAGRRPQLAAISAVVDQVAAGRYGGPLALVGGRGLGKTSLLGATDRHARGRGLTVVHVELSDDAAASVDDLLATVQRAVPDGLLQRLVGRIAGLDLGPVGLRLRAQDRTRATLSRSLLDLAVGLAEDDLGLLLLVDETQEAPSVAGEVVRFAHRAAVEHPDLPVGVVLVGLPSTPRRLIAEVSYAERITVLDLGTLDERATHRALAGPLADAGVTLSAGRAPGARTITGGYPYFVQLFGDALWRACDHPEQITPTAWGAAARATSGRMQEWHANRWRRVSEAGRAYLQAAADALDPDRGTAATATVTEVLGLTAGAASNRRDVLVNDGLLYGAAYGEVAFTIPPFAEWLRRGRTN